MKKQYFILMIIAGILAFSTGCRDSGKHKTLIITGQAEHDWQASSPVLKTPETTVEAKKLLLRELSWMGSDYCVSAIRDLTGNAELMNEAEFAVARLQATK